MTLKTRLERLEVAAFSTRREEGYIYYSNPREACLAQIAAFERGEDTTKIRLDPDFNAPTPIEVKGEMVDLCRHFDNAPDTDLW